MTRRRTFRRQPDRAPVECAGDAAPVQMTRTSSMIFLSLAYQAIDD
jgi:hypothetical protein